MAGPFAGIRKSWKVDDISPDIWSTLKAIGVVHASASRHNLKARKDACKQLVIMWCAMVTTNDKAAVAEFESNWGLDRNQSDTPDTKRRRIHDSKSAAVAESLNM